MVKKEVVTIPKMIDFAWKNMWKEGAKQMTKVHFVILTWNSEKVIGNCIDSL